MSRYVENMNRHVHSRHMVEQDMDWLKEFRDDPDYPGPDAEPGHDNDDNEQPSHHGGIQQIIIGGES